jgi:metal-responsive CopG/Arc/MetJ family transcriptional regulator
VRSTSFAAISPGVMMLAPEYNQGYTLAMKTAISIPDEVFEAADRTAKKLGLSRSELYATAVHEFLERHRIEDVTSKLDEVYATTKSGLDEGLKQMQYQSLDKEDW